MNEQHMTDELHNYFQDEKNCYRDLGLARKAFGSTATTEAEYNQMEKTLGLMYLHCTEDLQETVLATLQEAEFRRQYFLATWAKWPELDND